MLRRRWLHVLGLALLAACGELKVFSEDAGAGADAKDGAAPGSSEAAAVNDGGDGGSATDSQVNPPGKDGGATDGASPKDAGRDVGPTGLDPGVTLPDLGGEPCNNPRYGGVVCGGVHACRLATPDSGRCESCLPQGTCSNLVTETCTTTNDCDVNLQCFRGRCTLVCELPEGTECGASNACVDVGSPYWGLCDPAKL